jgi:hypothetical protein
MRIFRTMFCRKKMRKNDFAILTQITIICADQIPITLTLNKTLKKFSTNVRNVH